MTNPRKRDLAECLIVNTKNEILLQKKTLDYASEKGGPWCIFGGEIEKGEKIKQTLLRELKEELNFRPKKVKFFKSYKYRMIGKNFGSGCFGIQYYFICKFTKPISNISLHEGAGFAFFDKSELKKLNIAKIDRKVLKYFFKI